MMTLTWNLKTSIGFGNKNHKNGEFVGYVRVKRRTKTNQDCCA